MSRPISAVGEVSERFVIEVTVSEADVDAFGHVNNLVYVRWVQDVAARHSSAVGWDAADYLAIGGFFVVRRHELDYLLPALAGDTLAVTTWIARWGAASSTRMTEIHRVDDGALLARGVTRWAFVDAASQRPARIPDPVRAAFR